MEFSPSSPRTKPPALGAGDTIGIVAPASAIDANLLDAGCAALRRLGYKPFYLDSILEHNLYFAGPVKRRVRELEEMFERDEVRGIVCARGGYGCNHLLPKLDMEIVRRNPKVFVGYSDVTTLLTWFADEANLVTFHGPMVTRDFALPDGVDQYSWDGVLTSKTGYTADFGDTGFVRPLVMGEAEGMFYGGCLSMLVASLGTPYEIRTAGTILFIEDVAAKPYQIDRMLMHLKLAGKFEGVRGIVFGEMRDCVQNSEQAYTLEEVVVRVVGGLGIPVAFGLPSGHVVRGNMTLPIGVNARLQVGQSVKIGWEPAVSLAERNMQSAQS